ncbi:hypothetical protein OIU91_40700 [Streptomyces sp. NBC_01456]|uniref:hypothetical protein n=1 Tax=unclassified Streptomyces TaxID=2593676 RepID=UPI002E3527BF|nr:MULTISPECIES: hypothetical protein [unclassified Streptomyces]
MGGDYGSLTTDELCKILPIAEDEQDGATVHIIMGVLAERNSDVKQALAKWALDPGANTSISVVVLEALKNPGSSGSSS